MAKLNFILISRSYKPAASFCLAHPTTPA
uniref:Uncharacterized protein n=1 Tax=Anguilla anguilla TaxID=7936 RepID=A0A0E9VUU9_ANGAN